MLKALLGILVISTAVNKFLLAESTSLAGTKALIGAVLDNAGLPAAIARWSVDQSVVAEKDGALAVIAGGVLQAEGQAGVITALVVPPVLGGQLDAFGHSSHLDNRGDDSGRSGGLLSNGNSCQEQSTSNEGLHDGSVWRKIKQLYESLHYDLSHFWPLFPTKSDI